jgi:hypothetical protein
VSEHLVASWEAAAQEAAFENLCFAMVLDGRLINSDAMSPEVEHRSRYTLPDELLETFFKVDLQDGR